MVRAAPAQKCVYEKTLFVPSENPLVSSMLIRALISWLRWHRESPGSPAGAFQLDGVLRADTLASAVA